MDPLPSPSEEVTAYLSLIVAPHERAAIAAMAAGHSVLFHWDGPDDGEGEHADPFPCIETITEVATAFSARAEVVAAAFGWLKDVDGQWAHATEADTATCSVPADDKALNAALAVYRLLSPAPFLASLSTRRNRRRC